MAIMEKNFKLAESIYLEQVGYLSCMDVIVGLQELFLVALQDIFTICQFLKCGQKPCSCVQIATRFLEFWVWWRAEYACYHFFVAW